MKPTVATPRIPTTRMILRALLPPVVGVGGGGVGAPPGADGPAATAAPHLLQNFVSAVRVAPQELQNAISHLVGRDISTRRESIPQIGLESASPEGGFSPAAVTASLKRCPD